MPRSKNKEQLPDSNIVLTADELKELHGEPPELKALYLIINWRRDFATNVAGRVTHISDRTFKEGMGYIKKPGRKGWQPSTRHITRWLDQLENLGLIEQLGNYVFYCPMAHWENPNQKISHQGVTEDVTRGVTNSDDQKTTIKTDEKQILENEVSPEVSLQVARRLSTPLDTNTNTIPTYLGAQNFFDLLSGFGFPIPYLIHEKTRKMVNAWIKSNVTVEDARKRIQERIDEDKEVKQYPTYYRDVVIEPEKDLAPKNENGGNVKNESKRNTTHQQRNSSGKSTTNDYWKWSKSRTAKNEEQN